MYLNPFHLLAAQRCTLQFCPVILWLMRKKWMSIRLYKKKTHTHIHIFFPYNCKKQKVCFLCKQNFPTVPTYGAQDILQPCLIVLVHCYLTSPPNFKLITSPPCRPPQFVLGCIVFYLTMCSLFHKECYVTYLYTLNPQNGVEGVILIWHRFDYLTHIFF